MRIWTITKGAQLPKSKQETTFKIHITKLVVSKERLYKEFYQKRHAYWRSLPEAHINMPLKLHKGFSERRFVQTGNISKLNKLAQENTFAVFSRKHKGTQKTLWYTDRIKPLRFMYSEWHCLKLHNRWDLLTRLFLSI